MVMNIFVIVIILFLTLYKFYLKFAFIQLGKMYGNFFGSSSNGKTSPLEHILCSVLGFKCQDSSCDCEAICGSSPPFERVTIGDKNNYFMSKVKHEPGTYCFPKGLDKYLTYDSTLVYSSQQQGWSALPKFPQIWNERGQMVICASPFAQDNRLNYLFDEKEQRKVEGGNNDLTDLYETLPNGKLRYTCKCTSLDVRENRMVTYDNLFPFTCTTDHCKNEIFGAGFKGWDGQKCDCGNTVGNKDPLDPKSPCVVQEVISQKKPYHYILSGRCNNKYENIMLKPEEVDFSCPDEFNNVSNTVFMNKTIIFDEKEPYEILKKIVPHML